VIFSVIQFQASCHYSYLKTQGLVRGGIGHRATGSIPQPAGRLAGAGLQPAEETEAKNKSLTLMVFSASINWKLTFPSDALTVASYLFSSAKVKFSPLALRLPPEPALEAVSAHSFWSWLVELWLLAPDPVKAARIFPPKAPLPAAPGVMEALSRLPSPARAVGAP
jgi:hypothetical protein